MTRVLKTALTASLLAFLAGCGSVGVQQPPAGEGGGSSAATPSVQDLVGARGSSGEQVLQQRGFVWVKTEKTGDSSYSYWQHRRTGQCITVRTVNGRYASLVKSPAFDCRKK